TGDHGANPPPAGTALRNHLTRRGRLGIEWESLSGEGAVMWPEQPKTEQLLEQARRGEAEAVDRLLAAHRDGLRRMVGLRLDPALAARVDASDIVQDVLLEAHRRLNDYLRQPTMPFQLWLRHLAKDHMIDAHRRHRLAQRRSLDREQPLAARLPDDSSFELAGQLMDGEPAP